MQSATAVTFILVSLTDSGLIKARAAAPIIVWCNVGLTALAFVTTLNIHPIVAYVVGGAGIALGTLRIPFWQTLAGSLLGMGLILFGLEEMGAGAAPLKDDAWFQSAMSFALGYSSLTFLAGVLVAMLLQSNTGAAMLIITFAANGVLDLKPAVLSSTVRTLARSVCACSFPRGCAANSSGWCTSRISFASSAAPSWSRFLLLSKREFPSVQLF